MNKYHAHLKAQMRRFPNRPFTWDFYPGSAYVCNDGKTRDLIADLVNRHVPVRKQLEAIKRQVMIEELMDTLRNRGKANG